MAKSITKSGGGKAAAKNPAVKSGKPKKLSKVGEWMRAHPDGILEIVNMRAVLK